MVLTFGSEYERREAPDPAAEKRSFPCHAFARNIARRKATGVGVPKIASCPMPARPSRDVDAGTTAQDFTHGVWDSPSVQVQARFGDKPPIQFVAKRHRPAVRIHDHVSLVTAAGFQQEHPRVRIGCEPCSDNRPRRTYAAHDVVEPCCPDFGAQPALVCPNPRKNPLHHASWYRRLRVASISPPGQVARRACLAPERTRALSGKCDQSRRHTLRTRRNVIETRCTNGRGVKMPKLLSGCRRPRGFIDERTDLLGPRCQRRVAGTQGNNLSGAKSTRHPRLIFQMNHSVFAGNLIPGWLVLPGGCSDFVGERAADRRLLRHRHHQGLIGGQILAKALTEFLRIDPDVTVAIGGDIDSSGGHRSCLSDLTEALTCLRRERCNIDQARDVRRVAGFGDHRATVGMPHQKHRTVLLRDHLAGAIGIVGEGSERVLDRAQGLVPHSGQFNDNLAPVGGAAPEAMHKYDCWFAGHARFAFRGLGNLVVSSFAFGGADGAVERKDLQRPFEFGNPAAGHLEDSCWSCRARPGRCVGETP